MMDTQLSLRLVLVANRCQRNDGQGRVNYEVARAALEQGYHVTILAAFCADDIAAHPNARFVPLGRENLPTQFLRNLAFAFQSSQWLEKHRSEYDIVQANGFVTWSHCDIVTAHFVHTSWAKSPYYPFSRSLKPYFLYQRLFTAWNARWERRAYLGAKRVVAVSHLVSEELQQFGMPAERIEVICNGVDTEEFRPGESERVTFGLPEHVAMALFVGDIRSPRKNLATLLKAMLRVPELHLAVAGDTKRSPAVSLARDLGIASRVHFLGKVSDVPKLMRSVDLFIFPSRYEPFGLVALEAMASGLPVILSRNVGCASHFADVISVLEDADDDEALAALISKLLESPAHQEAMARAARIRSESLSWMQTTRAYLNLYRTLPGR